MAVRHLMTTGRDGNGEVNSREAPKAKENGGPRLADITNNNKQDGLLQDR